MLPHCFTLILPGSLCNHIQPAHRSQPAGWGEVQRLQLCAVASPWAEQGVLCSPGAQLSLPPRQGAGGAPSPASHSMPEAMIPTVSRVKKGEKLKLEGSIFHKEDVGTGCSRRNSRLPKHISSKDSVFLV